MIQLISVTPDPDTVKEFMVDFDVEQDDGIVSIFVSSCGVYDRTIRITADTAHSLSVALAIVAGSR